MVRIGKGREKMIQILPIILSDRNAEGEAEEFRREYGQGT